MLKYLRSIPALKDLRLKQLQTLLGHFSYQVKNRGSKLFEQGDKAEHVYIIRSGEVSSYMKLYKDRPSYKDTETKTIHKKPLQAHNQHSEHMTKNRARLVEHIDLGITGQMTPIGIIEAFQFLPDYVTTCVVTSTQAEVIRVNINIFVK